MLAPECALLLLMMEQLPFGEEGVDMMLLLLLLLLGLSSTTHAHVLVTGNAACVGFACKM
jgi:hypothetical protein